MGEKWGKMGKKWVTKIITGVEKRVLMHASARLGGVENIQEIAEHEVVTHLDIGPYDLCLSLGLDYYVERPPEDDDLQKAVDLVREAAESLSLIHI